MIYLDTSVVIPMFVPEAATTTVLAWLETSAGNLISADWILTEFASALFIKVRCGELSQENVESAWNDFEVFSQSGLRLIPVTRTTFTRGAGLIRKAANALRSGDALHLAMALEVGATAVATADEQLARSASAQGMLVIRF